MKKIIIKEFNKSIFKKKVNKSEIYFFKNNNIKFFIIYKRFGELIIYSFNFIFIIIYYLYYLSLEKCFDGESECSRKINWIKKKINEGLLCTFFLLFFCELMIHKIISKLHLIHMIIIFFYFYTYSHGLEFDDHGFFNFLGIITALIIGIIGFLPFNFLVIIIKSKNKLILFIYLLFLIFSLIVYKYYLTNFLGCENWRKGLNNTYLINDINKYSCQIKLPNYCTYKLIKYIFDLTTSRDFKCRNSRHAKNVILKYSKSKYINKNVKKIGFPSITNKALWSKKISKDFSILEIYRKYLIDMENKTLLNTIKKENWPEIIVDFSNNEKGKMIINLHFNKKLSIERKKKESVYHPYSNNIIILYFDSISRANGMRKLKKTLSFFEKFMPYNSKKFHSFQFFKYHSFKHYTPGNYPKLFFDKSNESKSEGIRITYYLKKYGFITAFSNDMCNVHPMISKMGITREEICDHEFLLCDPNSQHVTSMIKRCLYGKKNVEYQYEYGLQFWRLYKNNRKFLMIVNNDGHEGTLEVIKYDDDIVFNFLNNLYKDNLLNDTTILLLSDHGCSLPSIFYFNDFFQIEKHLPMLFIFASDKENLSYYEQYNNIYENQQHFITAYDIYNTLCYLILGNNYHNNRDIKKDFITKSNLGINLFDSINTKRSPQDYDSMDTEICK